MARLSDEEIDEKLAGLLDISWKTVTVTITTHSEGGFTANDFELAAKIDTSAE
jgi:pterin-4a-carbinolamine dehydratase